MVEPKPVEKVVIELTYKHLDDLILAAQHMYDLADLLIEQGGLTQPKDRQPEYRSQYEEAKARYSDIVKYLLERYHGSNTEGFRLEKGEE